MWHCSSKGRWVHACFKVFNLIFVYFIFDLSLRTLFGPFGGPSSFCDLGFGYGIILRAVFYNIFFMKKEMIAPTLRFPPKVVDLTYRSVPESQSWLRLHHRLITNCRHILDPKMYMLGHMLDSVPACFSFTICQSIWDPDMYIFGRILDHNEPAFDNNCLTAISCDWLSFQRG